MGHQSGTYATECVRAEQEGEVSGQRWRIKKIDHGLWTNYWGIYRGGNVEITVYPTWATAIAALDHYLRTGT